jgi:hypothetical protein
MSTTFSVLFFVMATILSRIKNKDSFKNNSIKKEYIQRVWLMFSLLFFPNVFRYFEKLLLRTIF